jgi:hypothetical protein
MMPGLNNVSRLGEMKDTHPLTIFRVQNSVILMGNGMTINAVALLPMTLFFTTLGVYKVAFGQWMDMLRMWFPLMMSGSQEYKIPADKNQRPREMGNANDRAKLLAKEALIRHLNTLLAIIWLLRGTSGLPLDRLSTLVSRISLACSEELSTM